LPLGQPDGPKFLLRPLFAAPGDYQGLQNTDPFVFGDTFYYCVCQQRGQMKRLAPSSVILFGSCRRGSFVLDTVFVVRDWITHDSRNYQKLDISEVYRAVGLSPLYAARTSCAEDLQDEQGPWRLYRAAMHSNPCQGMFSFFPCLPAAKSEGFGRPEITLSGAISDTLRQGLKISDPLAFVDAVKLWQAIVKQVCDQSLRLGVFAELPTTAGSGTKL
jgi:hypothetical protein